jgi:LAS superfamily LD-carboxypeptidase LdcB
VFDPSFAGAPGLHAGLGDEDGFIATGDSVSPFDTEHAAVANLDPALLQAVQAAATDARRAGVSMRITAGWRSERYQQALLDDAIREYGSEAEARRWVKTPQESSHVTGDAVDIGPASADKWLRQHGSDYGLCQVYSNEIWHFELATTPGGRCPRMQSDAAG